MPLDASAVAKLLHEFGQRTALRGGNPYRTRAYSRAAENLLAQRRRHVVERRTREFCVSNIFKRPRLPRATCS